MKVKKLSQSHVHFYKKTYRSLIGLNGSIIFSVGRNP